MKTHNIAGKPVWVTVLLLMATGSLAVGLLSPQLTKNGSITGTAAERVFISSVRACTNTTAPCTIANVGVTASSLGGEHFEAQFFVFVGEAAQYVVFVKNSGTLDTIAALSCAVPSGIFFSATATGDVTTKTTFPAGRIGPNTYVAYVIGTDTGTPKPHAFFSIFFKGLVEGEYSITCTLGEASNFPIT